ncbi:hypothetical protein U0070_020546 [Myodes glareolus]|uniref:Meiosis expressed gene 1 protein homolog n=2 Tax=Arvicolinae TaxID=39087 RepID=A0AAW0JAR9_MYOGA
MGSEDPGPDRRAPGSVLPRERKPRPFRPATLITQWRPCSVDHSKDTDYPMTILLTSLTLQGCSLVSFSDFIWNGCDAFYHLNFNKMHFCPCYVWKASGAMASSDVKPKSISRAKKWSEEIENLYRFQQAGYRDEIEYRQVKQVAMVDRWPETGYVKKLQRRDNTFYYYDKQRECEDKEVHKVKVYAY